MPKPKPPQPGSQRMPDGSPFFERVVPLLLVVLALLFVIMLLAAIAAFMGWVRL